MTATQFSLYISVTLCSKNNGIWKSPTIFKFPDSPASEDNLAIFLTVAATILESRAPSTEAESCSTPEEERGEELSLPLMFHCFFL